MKAIVVRGLSKHYHTSDGRIADLLLTALTDNGYNTRVGFLLTKRITETDREGRQCEHGPEAF
jgi:hypothetical protein